MIPQIEGGITQNIIVVPHPSRTHRFTENNIKGFVDNMEAMQQTIAHTLSIERYVYPIYEENYGVNFNQYVGENIAFIRATIENTLRDALLQDDRIRDIIVTSVEQIDIDSCEIRFTVFCNKGTFETAVNVQNG